MTQVTQTDPSNQTALYLGHLEVTHSAWRQEQTTSLGAYAAVQRAPQDTELLMEQARVVNASRLRCRAVRGTWPPETLAMDYDWRFCKARGLANLTLYQHGLPLDGGRSFLPVYSALPLSQRASHVERVIIWMHGARSNANKYFCDALNLTAKMDPHGHTLSVVPWFSEEEIVGSQWSRSVHPDARSACWDKASNWATGADSARGESTAFGLLDALIEHFQEETAMFPNLKHVFIAGFSGGCQMLSRWSFYSKTLVKGRYRAAVTGILGGCGSYLYLDNQRPHPQCSPLRHSGTEHSCDYFAQPEAEVCDTFDTYKYGMSLDGYRTKNTYLMSFGDYNKTVEEGRADFKHKDLRFIFGDADVCSCNVEGFVNDYSMCYPQLGGLPCLPNAAGGANGYDSCCDTYPGGTKNNVAFTCEAILQGTNRLQRGLNYMSYLRDLYARRQEEYEPVWGTFTGGHDSNAAYTSETFRKWVFVNDTGSSQNASYPLPETKPAYAWPVSWALR